MKLNILNLIVLGIGYNVIASQVTANTECVSTKVALKSISEGLKDKKQLKDLLFKNELQDELTAWDSKKVYSGEIASVFRTDILDRFGLGGPGKIKEYIEMDISKFNELLLAKINPWKKDFVHLLTDEDSIINIINLIPGGANASYIITGFLWSKCKGDTLEVLGIALDFITTKLNRIEYDRFVALVEKIWWDKKFIYEFFALEVKKLLKSKRPDAVIANKFMKFGASLLTQNKNKNLSQQNENPNSFKIK